MSTHTNRSMLAIALAVISVALACSGKDNTFSPLPFPNSVARSFVPMSSCGATFRAISNETDSLMVPYGIGTTVDTVDVCESWTGSDYSYQVVGVGSSENLPGFTDTVQTVAYENGYVTGYTQEGANAADPSSVGGTSFDFLRADNSTRQASYDDPYYGVSSHDPNACLQPPCPATSISIAPTRVNGGSTTSATSGMRTTVNAQDSLFARHGLSRRGVRALVNGSEEITPSARGYRRFRTVQGDVVVIRSIERVTQLLMEQESSSPKEIMHVTHKWAKVPGGYLLNRSDYVTTEQINGKPVTSFGSVELKNVRIIDPVYPPLGLPPISH